MAQLGVGSAGGRDAGVVGGSRAPSLPCPKPLVDHCNGWNSKPYRNTHIRYTLHGVGHGALSEMVVATSDDMVKPMADAC